MIHKITTSTLTYYEYRESSFSLLAFSLCELLRDLKVVHGLETTFFNFNLN